MISQPRHTHITAEDRYDGHPNGVGTRYYALRERDDDGEETYYLMDAATDLPQAEFWHRWDGTLGWRPPKARVINQPGAIIVALGALNQWCPCRVHVEAREEGD